MSYTEKVFQKLYLGRFRVDSKLSVKQKKGLEKKVSYLMQETKLGDNIYGGQFFFPYDNTVCFKVLNKFSFLGIEYNKDDLFMITVEDLEKLERY